MSKTLGLGVREVMTACTKSFYIAVLTVIPVALAARIESPSEANYLWFALGGGIVTGALWLLALKMFGHPLWSELAKLTQQLVSKFQKRA